MLDGPGDGLASPGEPSAVSVLCAFLPRPSAAQRKLTSSDLQQDREQIRSKGGRDSMSFPFAHGRFVFQSAFLIRKRLFRRTGDRGLSSYSLHRGSFRPCLPSASSLKYITLDDCP